MLSCKRLWQILIQWLPGGVSSPWQQHGMDGGSRELEQSSNRGGIGVIEGRRYSSLLEADDKEEEEVS